MATDNRTLFEKLQENKRLAEEQFDESHSYKNLIYKGLDDEEFEFLDQVVAMCYSLLSFASFFLLISHLLLRSPLSAILTEFFSPLSAQILQKKSNVDTLLRDEEAKSLLGILLLSFSFLVLRVQPFYRLHPRIM